jgi:hypothetical protein
MHRGAERNEELNGSVRVSSSATLKLANLSEAPTRPSSFSLSHNVCDARKAAMAHECRKTRFPKGRFRLDNNNNPSTYGAFLARDTISKNKHTTKENVKAQQIVNS